VVLGQQLLGDVGGNSDHGSIAADVLVAAGRQHLMSSAVAELKLPQVALLLADYQQLASSFYEQQMLSR
jgi:hypothetical protein